MSFDYSKIPEGYYDAVLNGSDGMRKFWHYHKFDSVMRYMPASNGTEPRSLLDFGCFAGSFLGLIPESVFAEQVGVDMLPTQIEYAQKKYATHFRKFVAMKDDSISKLINKKFDVITVIEVIEHLNTVQIQNLLLELSLCLKPNGRLIITTPNYLSLWPVLEWMIDMMSDVQYEEQHLTKFTFPTLVPQIDDIGCPFICEKKTTTHFITPYIATVSYPLAVSMSHAVPSSRWKNPFGSLILSSWKFA